jgi:hypothetical protein
MNEYDFNVIFYYYYYISNNNSYHIKNKKYLIYK